MPDERDKVAGTAAIVILAVAILVLVIDWQIKNAILAEAQTLRKQIRGFEEKYWNGQTVAADTDCTTREPDTSIDRMVGGIARVETTVDPEADSSHSWEGTHVERSPDARPGKRRMAIQKGDRPI